MSEKINMDKLGSILDEMQSAVAMSTAVDTENSRLRAQLAERDERISELENVASEALEVMGFEKWDRFLSYTPQFGTFVKLQRALTRATSSKISGGVVGKEPSISGVQLRCLVLSAHRKLRHKYRLSPLWVLVRDLTTYGSTRAGELCEALNLDPHQNAGKAVLQPLPLPPESSEVSS